MRTSFFPACRRLRGLGLATQLVVGLLLLGLVVPAGLTLAQTGPSFTTSATAPASVTAGAAMTITATATSTTGTNAVIDIEIYRQAGGRVFQKGSASQWFNPNESRSFSTQWQTPATIAPGVYLIKIGIFSGDWKTLYHWNHNGAQTTITTAGSPSSPAPTPTPAPSGTASGRKLYVAPWGWSSAAGTVDAPLGSIQAGLDRLAAGDTLYLRGGTYAPSATLLLSASGTADKPITIRNHPGETPVLDGRFWLKQVMKIEQRSHVVVEGLTFVRSAAGWASAGLTLARATDVVLRNVTARDHQEQGIFLDHHTRRIQILNCDLSRSPTGLSILGQHVVVDGCQSHDHDKMVNNGEDCDGDSVTGEHGGQAFDVAETPGPVEIRNSKGWNNAAWSTCYGRDGAFVEIYRAQNVYVHHNESRDGVVFAEVAGGDTSGVRLMYNQSTNEQFLTTHQANGLEIGHNTVRNSLTGSSTSPMMWIGSGGSFGSGSTTNFKFHHNTIATPGLIWQVLRAFDGSAWIDHNTYEQRGVQFGIYQYSDQMRFENWRARTGKDANSVSV